jgi:hypothetical protein
VLLRNHREFVPPQHFLERLTHILLRRRERMARSVFQRDDDDDDDDDDGGRVKHDKQKETNASLAAREDDRLLRATAEIFRRVNAQHPAALAARFDSSSESPTGAGWKPGKAHVRVGARTWTPLDSDRRAGSIREHGSEHGSVFETNASRGARSLDARDARVSGARARGARADWNRFAALVGAARGDSERLDALVDPGASGADSRGGEAKRAAAVAARAEGRGARANRRNAYADADFALDAKTKTKTKTGEETSDDSDSDDSDEDEDAPLGVALLFAHAVDVLVQDAHARIEVFESRVRERAAERARLAAETAAATPPPARRRSRAGADESPVPDSQPTPSSDPSHPDAADTTALPSGAWAGDLLRNALVYRLVGNHAPSDAERTRLFRDLLELAGAASRRAANDARRVASRDVSVKRLPAPGREDASPESLGHAAASLLSAFDDVLSAMHTFGATRGDRAAEKLRTQLDEARVRYFRADRRNLRAAGAKKAFLDAVAVAGGQEETRALRVVRGVLREKVTARRAPGLMRPGLGATAGASGALDVLRYVSDDVKDAVKCVETEDASTRRAEACDAVAHFAAAAAKAAARVVGREDGVARGGASRKTCADAFRMTHERFAEEARAGDALTAESAAAMDAAAGTLRCYE